MGGVAIDIWIWLRVGEERRWFFVALIMVIKSKRVESVAFVDRIETSTGIDVFVALLMERERERERSGYGAYHTCHE